MRDGQYLLRRECRGVGGVTLRLWQKRRGGLCRGRLRVSPAFSCRRKGSLSA
nr:MAG TPA: hypothetical protein [Caudoviricetes sp.]